MCTSDLYAEGFPGGANGHEPRCLLCVPMQSADGEDIDSVKLGALSALQYTSFGPIAGQCGRNRFLCSGCDRR